MAELKFIVSMDSSAFKDGAKDVMAQVKQMSNDVKKEGGTMQKEFDDIGAGMGKSLSKYLAAFGGAAVFKSLIDNIVRVRSEFQKAGVAIETMLGSKEKADALMQEVKQIAASSPLEFGDITRATQQMLSFNIAAEDAPKFIRAIGDVSMGEKERFLSLSLAFSQMSATGKLMGQDLLQMINAGFNPLAEISRTTGKSIAQLKDEMSKGAISAKMVQQAFIDATSAGGKFFGMSENAAKTISGQMSMLSDAVNAAFNEVGQKSEGLISGAIEATTTLVKNYETILKVLAALVANYGVYRGAVAAAIAIDKAHGVAQAALAAKTSILKAAQDALNKSMLLNPYVAAATALAALVTVIVAAATATDEFDKAQERLEEASSSVEASTAIEMRKLDSLNRKLSECEEGTEEYRQVKQQIIDQYSQYYAGLEQEWAQVGNLAAIYDKLTTSIRNAIAARQLKSFVDQQTDAYDKFMKDTFNKAYDTLKKKYGEERGSELYQKFFNLATRNDTKNLSAKDWKDLQDATFWTMRWGKNARDGIMDVRGNVLELVDDIRKGNKGLDSSIAKFKEMYQISDEAIEKTAEAKQEITKPITLTGGGGGGRVGKNDTARLIKEQAAEYDKIFELHQQQMTEQGRKNVDLELEVREAELKAQRESNAKRLKELELSKDREVVAITRWYEDLRTARIEEAKKLWDAQKGNEGKKFFESEEYKRAASDDAYTEAEKNALKRRMDATIAAYRNAIDDIAKEESAALVNFLREYGSYEEKRLAIAQDYARRIDEATSTGEKLALEAQYQDALKSLDIEQFKKQVNWEDVFGDLDGVSAQHLEQLRTQLERILEDGTMDAQNYKTIVEQINRIDEQIVERQNEWRKAIGLTIPAIEQQKKQEQEAARAQERVAALTKQQADAAQQVADARQALVDFIHDADVEVDAESITIANADKIKAEFEKAADYYRKKQSEVAADSPEFAQWQELIDENGEDIIRLQALFAALAGKEINLTNVTDNLAKAQAWAATATDAAGGSITKTLQKISEITSKVNTNIQSATDLINTLGIADTAFGRGFGEFANAAQSATNALSDLQNGNYVGVANNILNTFGSLGNALGALGFSGFGESDMTLVKDIERLTESNEALQSAVEDLTDEMSSGAVAEAPELYKQILDDINKSVANSQEMMRRSAAAYSNGFLGIGGKSSSNKKINDEISAKDWEQISRISQTTVRNASDFWNLTSKQMSEVAKRAPEIYGRIKSLADDGYKDAAQFMDDYIDGWRQLEEAETAYYEKMTNVSFDTIRGDFASVLMDMDAGAADMADNFEKYLQSAIINALIADNYEGQLKEWQKALGDAMEGGLTEGEAAALKSDWNAITAQALADRDRLAEAFDFGGSAEEVGAYGAAKSFSQEQGDELNGRLAAIQIGQQRSNESLLAAVTNLQNLSVVIAANQGTLGEMRNLMLIGNGHLEDIARYTRLTSQNSELLQSIATKIDTL